jgi:hypothetical protein
VSKKIHAEALQVWRRLGEPDGPGDPTVKSIARRMRKLRRQRSTTNGRATAARRWPAKDHPFDRCADCLEAQGKRRKARQAVTS